MEEYVCSIWDLPSKLYRVHYAGCRTAFSSQQGFVASDTTKTFRSGGLNECRQAIEKQFTWSCREPLPFISLFSDERHAEDWGRKEPWRGQQRPNGNWTLHIIDTVELRKTTHLFRLSDLAVKLCLDIPEGAKQHIHGAFLCLHHIPASAIVESKTPADIEEGRYPDVDVSKRGV